MEVWVLATYYENGQLANFWLYETEKLAREQRALLSENQRVRVFRYRVKGEVS